MNKKQSKKPITNVNKSKKKKGETYTVIGALVVDFP